MGRQRQLAHSSSRVNSLVVRRESPGRLIDLKLTLRRGHLNSAFSLFLFSGKKRTIFMSFGQVSPVLTARSYCGRSRRMQGNQQFHFLVTYMCGRCLAQYLQYYGDPPKKIRILSNIRPLTTSSLFKRKIPVSGDIIKLCQVEWNLRQSV